jgi:hypothetical protein
VQAAIDALKERESDVIFRKERLQIRAAAGASDGVLRWRCRTFFVQSGCHCSLGAARNITAALGSIKQSIWSSYDHS